MASETVCELHGGTVERVNSTDNCGFGEVEVGTGPISNHRIDDFSDKSDGGLCLIGQKPDKTLLSFLRIFLEIEATKVRVVGTRYEVDGSALIENGGDGVGERIHDKGGGRRETAGGKN